MCRDEHTPTFGEWCPGHAELTESVADGVSDDEDTVARNALRAKELGSLRGWREVQRSSRRGNPSVDLLDRRGIERPQSSLQVGDRGVSTTRSQAVRGYGIGVTEQ
jgi:hypothetical protein